MIRLKLVRDLLASPRSAALEHASFLLWNFISFVLPVLVLGLAARRISPTAFGVLAFAQGMASFLAKIAEFGFNIVGPRAIAIHHKDTGAMTGIVSGIMVARIPISILLAILCLLAGRFAPYFQGRPSMPLAVFIFSLWSCFHVMWYYQGAGVYRIAVAYETMGRLGGVACMFLFLHGDSDAWMAIGFLAIGGVAAQIGLALRISRYFDIGVGIRQGAHWFRNGLQVFYYRVAEGFYSNAATIILPFLVTPIFVGNFAVAEKVTRATVRMTYFIYGAAYPRFARLFHEDIARARRAMLQVLGLLTLAALCAVATESALAHFIVHILMGRTPDEAVLLMQWMALLVLPSAISVYVCEAVLPAAQKPPHYAVQIYGGGCAILAVGLFAVHRQSIGPIFLLPVAVAECSMFIYAGYLLWTILVKNSSSQDTALASERKKY